MENTYNTGDDMTGTMIPDSWRDSKCPRCGHYESHYHVRGIFWGKPYTWIPSGGYTFHIYDCSKFINVWLNIDKFRTV